MSRFLPVNQFQLPNFATGGRLSWMCNATDPLGASGENIFTGVPGHSRRSIYFIASAHGDSRHPDKNLISVECHQSPPSSVDDPEQSVRLSFMSARCRWTSSARAAAIDDRALVHQQTSKP